MISLMLDNEGVLFLRVLDVLFSAVLQYTVKCFLQTTIQSLGLWWTMTITTTTTCCAWHACILGSYDSTITFAHYWTQ